MKQCSSGHLNGTFLVMREQAAIKCCVPKVKNIRTCHGGNIYTHHILICACLIYFQDTCVGFLLGGVGEINKNRHPNFMVVDKSK